MTNLESGGTHICQDLAALVHEHENASDWLDENQLADLKSYEGTTLCWE